MSDLLTVLRCAPSLVMAKTWKADGSILPYDRAKNFHFEQHPVAGIHDLSALLRVLERDERACIIRGQPIEGSAPGEPIRRLAENFDDRPLHTILIEVDDYAPLVSHPFLEPVDAALEFVAEHLPEPFHDTSFHWQLSNSAGAPGKESTLKIHLWFFLSTPYDSATLRAWAKSIDLKVDLSVFNIVQCHFASSPVFEEGRVDPVPVRSGFHQVKKTEVSLQIDTDSLDIRTRSARQRGERREVEDPLADWLEANHETWGELPNGGLIVSCPFEHEHHSGSPGDTSTVFFPAGTNGYTEGRWVCKHNACHDRPQGEFTRQAGYDPLSALAEPQPVVHLNGHHIPEEDLPWFDRRQGTGAIKTTVQNLHRAIQSPKAVGMDIRLDTFREEIMWKARDSERWRTFQDEHYTDVQINLEATGFEPVQHDHIKRMVWWRASNNTFDTAQAWLQSIEWDGVPRIEEFWIDHFGVVDDMPGYARAVGLYTWTALAGRVLVPGVQADMAPILTGPQGMKKSRGVKAMAPLEERRFVMFATTNDEDFLDDPNGERRWLPIAVGRQEGFVQVDISGIEAVRDQLWAEGRERFMKSGVAWQKAERLAKMIHGLYKSDDLWQDAIRRWLGNKDMSGLTPLDKEHLTTFDVAEGALSMPAKTVKYGDQRRIAKVLKDEGFKDVVKQIDGRPKKVWVPARFV